MITVNFKQKCGLLISYKVDGHAEYEIDNEIIYDDVVCGVVSNLAQGRPSWKAASRKWK